MGRPRGELHVAFGPCQVCSATPAPRLGSQLEWPPTVCPSLRSSCTGHLSPRGVLASPFSMAFSAPSTSGRHQGLWLQQGLPREDSEAKKLEAGSSQQRNCSSFLPSRDCSQHVAYFWPLPSHLLVREPASFSREAVLGSGTQLLDVLSLLSCLTSLFP